MENEIILNLLFASNQDFKNHNETISVFDFIVTAWNVRDK